MNKPQLPGTSNFIKKVYSMATDDQNRNQISWSENGKSIIIFNQSTFSNKTLPKYFKHSNYCSFVRQLNMYNFHKMKQSEHVICFQHECFRRDDTDNLVNIKRKPQLKKSKQQVQTKSNLSQKNKRCNKNQPFIKQNQVQSSKENIYQQELKITQNQIIPIVCQSSISISGGFEQPSPRRSIFGDLVSPRNYFSPINFDAFVCSYQNFLQ